MGLAATSLTLLTLTAPACRNWHRQAANAFVPSPASGRLSTSLIHKPSSLERSQQSVCSPQPHQRSKLSATSSVSPPAPSKDSDQSTDVVKAIFSDVDGTLLPKDHMVSKRVVDTITKVLDKGMPFIPATGKSRRSVEISLGPVLGPRVTTKGYGGVYLQGGVVYKGSEVFFERTIDPEMVLKVVEFVTANGCDVALYNRDDVITDRMNERLEQLPRQHEPITQVVPFEKYFAEGGKVHKMMILGTKEGVLELKKPLREFVGDKAAVTQALVSMIEVLPPGGSKGDGVRRLAAELNFNPKECMGIGDGENDLEMFDLVGTPVAMGNGLPIVKERAKYTMPTNDEDGAAVAFERFAKLN